MRWRSFGAGAMLQPMAAARSRERPSFVALEPVRELEGVDDREDVPAAVVCVVCGGADCTDCDAASTHSGLVAFVPWERPFAPWPVRLWQTARLVSREPDRFFESMPDGSLYAAATFAIVSELLSSTAMFVASVPLALAVAPSFVAQLWADVDMRMAAVHVLAASLPALATLMVLAHLAHGVALAAGARRAGLAPRLRNAVRFGLYSSGWDVMLGPLGFAVTFVTEGPRSAMALVGAGMTLPSRSARAFVRGAYRVEGAAAKKVLTAGTAAAGVVTVLGAVLVFAWILYLAFF